MEDTAAIIKLLHPPSVDPFDSFQNGIILQYLLIIIPIYTQSDIERHSVLPKSKKETSINSSLFCVSVDLFSRAVASQVFSALVSLTSVFEMGTGGPSRSSALTSQYTIVQKAQWKLNKGERNEVAKIRRSSPRPISISRLNVLPHLHLWPINHVVYMGPYSFRMGDLISEFVSRLDAFSVYQCRT